MIRLLNNEEREQLYHRYRESDLYCHWSPILNQLEWEEEELSAIDIWWLTELMLQKLRDVDFQRDEMIPYLFKNLLKSMDSVSADGKEVRRSVGLAENSAVTAMCVLMFRLMNAVDENHEEEEFDNRPMCIEIANLIRNHPRFSLLEERFFKRKKGNDGNKIKIKPSDPMDIETQLRDMDEKARKEVEDMSARIIELTKGLRPVWGTYWSQWEELCREICLSQDLLNKMKEVEPRNNDWKLNQKMICNTIGIFRTKLEIDKSVAQINGAISSKQLGSYLRQHADYNGTDSALTREQHQRIEKLIENKNNAGK